MVKREKELQRIDESFEKWLEANHFKDKSLAIKIAADWQEIVGNTIYNHTERIDVKPPKIYLKINNASLKEMLYIDSFLLIDKINQYVQADLIKEIIFT